MAISRSYPAGWNVFDKLTSVAMNALDTALTYALDKRAGQTDTLGSVVSAQNAGRLVGTSVIGADADTTYTVANGIGTIKGGTLTADRTYTLSVTGAINNDVSFITASAGGNINVVDGSTSSIIAIVGASGVPWIDAQFNGTAWTVLAAGSVGGASLGVSVAIARGYVGP